MSGRTRIQSLSLAVLAAALCLSVGLSADERPPANQIRLPHDLVFAAVGGEPVTVAAGTYEVDLTSKGDLRLTGEDGKVVLLEARNGSHDQQVGADTALLVPAGDEIGWSLVLLRPDGDIAEAIGAPPGVETRGLKKPVSRSALLSARTQKLRTVKSIPTKAVLRPDLVVENCVISCKDDPNLGYYPADGCAGGYTTDLRYRLQATIANHGNGAADFEEGWRIWGTHGHPGFAQDGYPAQTAQAGGFYLVAGAERSSGFGAPSTATTPQPAGTVTIQFEVDPQNKIAESNENNNILTCSWTVVQGSEPIEAIPDLTVTSVSVTPSSGGSEAGFVMGATVRNDGNGNAYSVRVNCEPGGTKTISSLAVGASASVTMNPLSYPLSPGQKTATCTVDPYDSIEESDENNNSKSKSFTVTQ